MVPYLSRKIAFIVLLTVVSIWSMFEFSMNLGLDLQGGARIVYSLPEKEANLQAGESMAQIVGETIQVFQKRLDGSGMKDVSIVPQGDNGIVIEMPGRDQSELNRIKDTIINQGRLEFRIVAEATDPEYDLNFEAEKFRTWRAANPDAPVIAFNGVDEAAGGRHRSLVWKALTEGAAQQPNVGPVADLLAVPLRDQTEINEGGAAGSDDSWHFTGDQLQRAQLNNHQNTGELVVEFEFQQHKKLAFEYFTGTYEGRGMAIVLNDVVDSAPRINSPLKGGGFIEGGGVAGFSHDEASELVLVLKTGSLRVAPKLESQSYIGPQLGEASIKIGEWSAALGGLLVLLFMLAYYRLNGVVACASLLFNGFILLGALSFTQATLTLPGLAGLVLTIGMAVDANILIFERVREERKRGREVAQAYKNGFERAFTTIIDANLTTLITTLILWKVGTGPVKGFAATLSLGVLTSMFSSLVFSKVIFHGLIFGKGGSKIREVKMAKAFGGEAHFGFLQKRKVAAFASIGLIVAGIVMVGVEGGSMLGIDFTGGSVVKVQLKEPTASKAVIDALPNNYSVTTVEVEGEEGLPAGTSSHFQIKIKATAAALAEAEVAAGLEAEAAAGLEAEGGSETWVEHDLKAKIGGLLHADAPFLEINTIGQRVSGQIQQSAIQAILLSMIAIVIYMNFRFKEFRYGIAAVVALLHDVLFTMGALAVFHYLGLVNVDVNLEIIAAFLTIIGYSLNDTIVVFDRIRENLPRRSGSYMEVINLSINQSLSRTILTSVTTFVVLLVLFLANRPQHNVLEGFSFAMLVGVVVGTYSSMFVASPMLVFLDRWAKKKRVAVGTA
ncbi:MAG: protein translocase subunit SecD [Planctomycetes bacterium]|nr:protein translocase subunit SecD [Planctomycetota bacterium]MBL7008777.1 protein translocase subunit SecD [Planctomycetota bacterium]